MKASITYLLTITLLLVNLQPTLHAQPKDPASLAKQEAAFQSDSYPEAKALMMESIALAKQSGSTLDVGEAYNFYGRLAAKFNQLDDLLEAFTTSVEYYAKTGNERKVAIGYNNIGVAHDIRGENQLAMDFYVRCMEIVEPMGDSAQMASTLGNMGLISRQLGNTDTAVEQLKWAANVSPAGDRANYERILNNLADTYSNSEMLDQAVKTATMAIPLAEESKNYNVLSGLFVTIGLSYVKLGQPELAQEYLHKALAIGERISNYTVILGAADGLAYSYESERVLDSALYYYDYILEIDNPGTNCKALHNISLLYTRYNPVPDSAYQYAFAARATSLVNDDWAVRIPSLIILARSAAQLNKLDIANSYLDTLRMERGLREDNDLDDQTLLLLSQAHQLLGNDKLASIYADSAYHFLDESRKIAQKGSNDLAAYESLKLENEIISQQYALKEQTRKTSIFRQRAIAMGLGVLALLVFGVLQYRQKMRERRLSGQLKQANEKLETAREDILHRVKNDFQAVRSMIDIQAIRASSDEESILLENVGRRINALGEVHSYLHQRKIQRGTTGDEYFNELLPVLTEARSIPVEVEIGPDVKLPESHSAIAWLGVMIDELLTNADKYGDGRPVRVSTAMIDGLSAIEVSNYVVADYQPGQTSGSGSNLLQSIAKQLDWSFEQEYQDDQFKGTIILS